MSQKDPIRVAAGRIGGLTRAARYEPRELTAAPRAAFLARFEREADPDGILSPQERARRAEALRRAHMARLAMASARARAKGRAS